MPFKAADGSYKTKQKKDALRLEQTVSCQLCVCARIDRWRDALILMEKVVQEETELSQTGHGSMPLVLTSQRLMRQSHQELSCWNLNQQRGSFYSPYNWDC